MQSVWPVVLRTALVFAAFFLLQFYIPYYILVPAGLIGAFFIWKTGDDRALPLALLIGSLVFGIFAWAYGNVQ